MSPTSVHVLLSATGGSALQLLKEVQARGLEAGEPFHLRVSPQLLEETRGVFAGKDNVTMRQWEIGKDGAFLSPEEPDPDDDLVFWVYEGPESPVDFIEALAGEARAGRLAIIRVITQIDCERAMQSEQALHWYGVCVHFSDLVLLDHRENVPQKWIREYREKFEKECYPCLFDLVKNGLPKQVSWLFDSQPRRLSLAFDPLELALPEIEENNGENDSEEEFDPAAAAEDPYFKKNLAGERELRVKPFPEKYT